MKVCHCLGQMAAGNVQGTGANAFPLITIFFKNATREVFEVLVELHLQSPRVCEAYGINIPVAPDRLWRVLTPHAASGMSSILCQLVIVPRTMDKQDLHGHMKDDGRRNVALSRARQRLSMHVSVGCTMGADAPATWSKHFGTNGRVPFEGSEVCVCVSLATQVRETHAQGFCGG